MEAYARRWGLDSERFSAVDKIETKGEEGVGEDGGDPVMASIGHAPLPTVLRSVGRQQQYISPAGCGAVCGKSQAYVNEWFVLAVCGNSPSNRLFYMQLRCLLPR